MSILMSTGYVLPQLMVFQIEMGIILFQTIYSLFLDIQVFFRQVKVQQKKGYTK
jgi:hypothetical protein